MATIIKGLLSQNLPWGLVLVGVFVAVTLELCGIHSLSFAVGAYLPIATTAPIFAGGLVRWWVERTSGVKEESELGAGTLFSSGLDRRRVDLRHSVRRAGRHGNHRAVPGHRQRPALAPRRERPRAHRQRPALFLGARPSSLTRAAPATAYRSGVSDARRP